MTSTIEKRDNISVRRQRRFVSCNDCLYRRWINGDNIKSMEWTELDEDSSYMVLIAKKELIPTGNVDNILAFVAHLW